VLAALCGLGTLLTAASSKQTIPCLGAATHGTRLLAAGVVQGQQCIETALHKAQDKAAATRRSPRPRWSGARAAQRFHPSALEGYKVTYVCRLPCTRFCLRLLQHSEGQRIDNANTRPHV
jgi:hypothetical protein